MWFKNSNSVVEPPSLIASLLAVSSQRLQPQVGGMAPACSLGPRVEVFCSSPLPKLARPLEQRAELAGSTKSS